MALPNNILQAVQTYQRSGLAYLQNYCCFLHNANKKFQNFQDREANLGSSITFDLPPRATVANGLVASFQPAVQRVATLSVTQAANASFEFNAQQLIYNIENNDYADVFGKSFIMELGNRIESNLALNSISGVAYGDPNQTNFGQLNTSSGPYRFFGDGTTALNSYQQLAQMVANFRNYGAVSSDLKIFLPDVIIPGIVGSGLSQFAPRRNDDIAMSWEVGDFGTPVNKYYQSNLLPIQVSGNVGNASAGGNVLTVISTNDPTGANITQLTFSGATASDSNAINAGDLFQFKDGVSGQPNMRYLTFIGHTESAQPVQCRVTADAGADSSGHVTVNITPALQFTAGANQNINNNIVAGMKATFVPTHRAGLVYGGDAFYVAMPRLPDQSPYMTANEYDEDTGASIRLTKGAQFGQNVYGWIYDCVWDSFLVPEYSMRICLPV